MAIQFDQPIRLVLRGYLILVAVLVAVKFAQLVGGFGH
jgi:hypothetical protein